MIHVLKTTKKQPYESDVFRFFIYADTSIVVIKFP